MPNCGICLKQDECDKCKKCYVGICDDCRHMTKYDTGGMYYAPVVSLCDFCMPKSEYEFISQRLTALCFMDVINMMKNVKNGNYYRIIRRGP